MKLRLWGVFLSFAVVALTVLSSRGEPAHAAVMRALTMEELTLDAEHIFIATAVAQHSRWDGRGRIVTDVDLTVERVLKGDSQIGQILTMTVLGGTVGDVGMKVEGEALFNTGQRNLVFARPGLEAGRLRPVGMSQGVMPIYQKDGKDMVSPGGAGAIIYQGSPGTTSSVPALAEPTSLPRVLDMIERARDRLR